MRRWLGATVATVVIALLCVPNIALACPFCADQNDGGIGRLFVIGAMIATPFMAVLISVPLILRSIRNADADARLAAKYDGSLENSRHE